MNNGFLKNLYFRVYEVRQKGKKLKIRLHFYFEFLLFIFAHNLAFYEQIALSISFNKRIDITNKCPGEFKKRNKKRPMAYPEIPHHT